MIENKFNENDELIFLGMNIVENVLDTIIKTKKEATSKMTENERVAYEMGVSNTLSYLQVLLSDSDGVVINTFGKPQEYTYEDLKEYYMKLRTALGKR